jgi:hypothetical protein
MQSLKFALQIAQKGEFCSHAGKPLGAKRSSSRVSDSRMVLTRLVPSTEFTWIEPVSSRSHSCCAAVSVTAALAGDARAHDPARYPGRALIVARRFFTRTSSLCHPFFATPFGV